MHHYSRFLKDHSSYFLQVHDLISQQFPRNIYLDGEFIYLFVRDKLQDGRTNLNQTFCGDSDYPRIEFRLKRLWLQPKRSEKECIYGPI